MKKPSEFAIWFYKNWPIHGIKVTWDGPVGAEQSYVTIASAGGTKKVTAEQFEEQCNLRREFNSICELRTHIKEHVANWLDFEKSNAIELAEYERLKQKFET